MSQPKSVRFACQVQVVEENGNIETEKISDPQPTLSSLTTCNRLPTVVKVRPCDIRQFLREVLLEELDEQKNNYHDENVDALMLEVKNFKNVNEVEPGQLLGQAIQVILDNSRLHKTSDYMQWSGLMKHNFQPLQRFWKYIKQITDEHDHTEYIFQLYEYCQNRKRPHLQEGFPYIISTLVAGDILCSEAFASFLDALARSEDEHERELVGKYEPFLSHSCPW